MWQTYSLYSLCEQALVNFRLSACLFSNLDVCAFSVQLTCEQQWLNLSHSKHVHTEMKNVNTQKQDDSTNRKQRKEVEETEQNKTKNERSEENIKKGTIQPHQHPVQTVLLLYLRFFFCLLCQFHRQHSVGVLLLF